MRLFVGNLHVATTSEALRAHFAAVPGLLDARVITDYATGESRRFGYVEYDCDATGLRAQKELHGSRLDGLPLRIEVAVERARERWA